MRTAVTRSMFAVALALLTFAYGSVGYHVVFQAKMGPIVTVLTPTHGVHEGDMLGFAAFAFAVICAVGSAMLLGSIGRRPAVRTSYRPY